jgi:hypothetical protein
LVIERARESLIETRPRRRKNNKPNGHFKSPKALLIAEEEGRFGFVTLAFDEMQKKAVAYATVA